MNERCSIVVLNKLPSKEKDPRSFTIPCDIGQLHVNNALADLGASISLMPYMMYKKLGLGEPKATRMSLVLADRSIQYPRGIIEDVLIKVDKFSIPIDFVILDMPEDSRVPIILGRPFLATARAMIDVFNKKITLRVGDDEVIFDVDQSIKRPTTEDDECYGIDDLDETINEEAQELLTNEEPDSFLSRGLEKSIDQSDLECCESTSSNDKNGSDSENSIRHIDSINTPYPVTQRTSNGDNVKSEHLYSASANEIDEKKSELKNLPQHLEYAYLHGDKSFPIIISSELSENEKTSLLQVLERRKGAIAWKMSDIKGISLSYCTHKILMEGGYKQSSTQGGLIRKKVQDVVKNEIVKLLDSGLIYPISDSSWVSPIHVVPKKGGMTVVLNDNNELIPSRTVTGWRVCIDYRKLNDATRKDHFPLPFIDQMLERLCGNEYYCFLDGFSGFFQIPIANRKLHDGYLPQHGGRIYGSFHGRLLGGTTNEKELLAVVFSFDKFRQYLILSKTMVYTDHSALKYLFNKEDVKPRLIGWVLLLQAFDIEIKDKKGAENLAADHLSRLKNPDLGTFAEEEITDEFPDEHLMILKAELNNDEPWGHHSASITGTKVYKSRFYWPRIFKDAKDYVMKYDACQRSGNISSRSEMPQNNIQLRDEAYENTWINKERTKKWHDSRLRGDKNFKEGDKVLIFNSRFKIHPRKLKSKWYSPLKKYHDGYNNMEEKEVVEMDGPRERNIDEYWWRIYISKDLKVLES
ncbi:reverse transcriptase domain-containing protein [Tanacetum coccineum]|uniref:RNA-directed DNA polymerase n=1 Tax=Tanacetum coccineum TaxID=301880 RepID=A0ABQ4WCY0_9ASTR